MVTQQKIDKGNVPIHTCTIDIMFYIYVLVCSYMYVKCLALSLKILGLKGLEMFFFVHLDIKDVNIYLWNFNMKIWQKKYIEKQHQQKLGNKKYILITSVC